MKTEKQSRSRVATDESHLCQFPFADGRQCRMFRHASHETLCLFHIQQEQQLLALDRIGDELASLSGEFTTVSDVNHVIGRLFKLVASNRIPRRNAELLAYLAQLLLYSQKDVKQEQTIARGYFNWESSLREIYVNAGLAQPQASPSAGSPPIEQK